MKKLLSILLITFSLTGSTQEPVGWFGLFAGGTVFVDANASLPGNGSLLLPYNTIDSVSNKILAPGSKVKFRRGRTYSGSINVANSGTGANPIEFSAYGAGDKPVITGFTTVTEWVNNGDSTWTSVDAVTTLDSLKMVVIGGVNTPMGREPDAGYYFFQSHVDGTQTQITSSDLDGVINWTGAECVVNYYVYASHICEVASQSGSTLTLNEPTPFSIYGDNMKFIIQDDIRTLDQQNEWYFNDTTRKLTVYSITEPQNVKVSSINNLMLIENVDYITVKNIEFQGSNYVSIRHSNADNITIDNCNFNYSGGNAFYSSIYNSSGSSTSTSSNITISNCNVNEANNGGLISSIYASNVTMSNNRVTNIGMIYGSHSYYKYQFDPHFVAIESLGSNAVVTGNYVSNIGYSGIRPRGNNSIVDGNYITNFCMVNTDGGGIYTAMGFDPASKIRSGIQIKNNVIINTNAFDDGQYPNVTGIYHDNGSNGITTTGNTIHLINGNGIFLHNDTNITVRENVIYNSDNGLLMYNDRYTEATFDNVLVRSNYIINDFENDYSIQTDYLDYILSITSFDSDSNKYIRRNDNSGFIFARNRNPLSTTTYDFADWQTYSSLDENSTLSDYSGKSFYWGSKILVNSSLVPKTFYLNFAQDVEDVDGNSITANITLQPYTAKVIFGEDVWCVSETSQTFEYEPELTVYITGLSTALSDTAKRQINWLAREIKSQLYADSLSERIDVFGVYNNETNEAALRNLAKRSHDATAYNTPTFTAWNGIAFNGSNQYLDRNFTPSTDGVNFTLNDASYMMYVDTMAPSGGTSMYHGVTNLANTARVRLGTAAGSSSWRWELNDAAGQTTAYSSRKNVFIGISRDNSANIDTYIDETKTVKTSASVSLPDESMFTGARQYLSVPGNYVETTLDFEIEGGSFTDKEMNRIYWVLDWYVKK